MAVVLLVLYFVQFLIAAGFASFAMLSRLGEDRAFPKEQRGSGFARTMYRGRLHLVLVLLGLEAVVLALIAVMLHGWIALEKGAVHFFVSLVVVALSVIAVTAAGFGIATSSPSRAAAAVSWPLVPLYLVLRPLAEIFLQIIGRIFPNLPREMASPFFLFSSTADDSSDGFISRKGSSLIKSIQEFSGKKVRDVMVPRIDVFAIDVHSPIGEVRRAVTAAGHSRVPAYDGSIDRIVGMLHVKDLLKVEHWSDESRLDRMGLIRRAHFVPESKKIDDLLREFQRERTHLAIVVDEYGGTAGIVTIEDILEEIVGEIHDEYDREAPLVREIAPRTFLAAGRSPIEQLNSQLRIEIPTDEVDTLGGFIYKLIGRVPAQGEEVQYGSLKFRVERLEGQRIVEVVLWLPQREPEKDS